MQLESTNGDCAAIFVGGASYPYSAAMEMATPEFARGLRALATEYGALLVLDEIRTNFRVGPSVRGHWASLSAAPDGLDVAPDMSCICKAVANGHPLAALVGGARAVSIQLQLSDTTAQPCMGSLEVLPGSHRPDAARARPEQIKRAVKEPTPSSGVLAVAVPAGSVTLYSSRLWHRGGANRSDRERTFCFLTVSEPDAPAPAGLIHTMERDEVGGWMLDHRGLQARSPDAERAKHKTSQRR